METLKCPLCSGNMLFETVKGKTPMWNCQECPARLYEYVTMEDTKRILTHDYEESGLYDVLL
jgi:hypothetical protein